MKKVRITVPAASLVRERARWFEAQMGPGFAPVIMWQVDHSGTTNFVPRPALGFEKLDVVDRSRAMECEGKEVDIYQYVPDELFGENAQKFIDRNDDGLVLADELTEAPS